MLGSQINTANGFQPFGIASQDGSAIQVFYNDAGKCITSSRDYRIPQDRNILRWDFFCIFLDVPDTNERFVTFELYEQEQSSVTTFNEETNKYETHNVTDYTKLIGLANYSLSSGQNELNDPRFALMKVDHNNFVGFTSSDQKTLIKFQYNELNYEFIHQTDYSLVPITQSRGEQNMVVIIQLIILVVLIIISVALSSIVYFKVGTVMPKISLATFALLITWFIFSLFFYVYLDTESISDTLRQITVLRPEMFSLLIAAYMFLWLPSQYRPKELGESLLIALDIPFVSAKDIKDTATKGDLKQSEVMSLLKHPKSKRKRLYSYLDKDGRKQYAKDPDSYLDLISRAIFGGLKLDMAQTLIIPDINGKDELIFVFDFKENEIEFIKSETKKMIYGALILGAIGSLILGYLIWVPLVIITTACVIGFLLLYMYENISTKYNYNLKKCTRNVLSAMYDAKTVKALDNEIDILLHENMELEREKMLTVSQAKGEWMFDWENELFADNFEDLFGSEFTEEWDKRIELKEQEREEIRNTLFSKDKKFDTSS